MMATWVRAGGDAMIAVDTGNPTKPTNARHEATRDPFGCMAAEVVHYPARQERLPTMCRGRPRPNILTGCKAPPHIPKLEALRTPLAARSAGRALLRALLLGQPARVVDELLFTVLVQRGVGVQDFGDEVLGAHACRRVLGHD